MKTISFGLSEFIYYLIVSIYFFIVVYIFFFDIYSQLRGLRGTDYYYYYTTQPPSVDEFEHEKGVVGGGVFCRGG